MVGKLWKLGIPVPLFLALVLFLAGCGVNPEIQSMPLTPQRLYLFDDALNLAFPNSSDIIDQVAYQPAGRAMSKDWTFLLDDQVLKPTLGYCIFMRTSSNVSVQAEFLVKSGLAETSLGMDSSAMSTNQWQFICGEVAIQAVATKPGDQLIFRVSLETDRWTISLGSDWVSWVEVFEGTQTVTEEMMNTRTNALQWFAANMQEYSPSTLDFVNFVGQVDYIITSGTSGVWQVGDQFAKNGQPFQLTLNAEGFQASKLGMDEIPEYLQGTDRISFNPTP